MNRKGDWEINSRLCREPARCGVLRKRNFCWLIDACPSSVPTDARLPCVMRAQQDFKVMPYFVVLCRCGVSHIALCDRLDIGVKGLAIECGFGLIYDGKDVNNGRDRCKR